MQARYFRKYGPKGYCILAQTNIDHGAHCPAETALDFLSGKWRPMVIFWLMNGPLRFNELQRRLGSITHRTLSKTLKEMEADGLLKRKDYGEIPPRVDYALTDLGKSLQPVLIAMEQWALAHRGVTLDRTAA
jgi:DNA-binding HxlR family transcriptional regulator